MAALPPRCPPAEAASMLLQATRGRDDACLIYLADARGVRLAGAAASAPLTSALLPYVGEPAPRDVLQVVHTACPSITLYAHGDEVRTWSPRDGWPVAALIKPREVLITPIEGDTGACGALVMMRLSAGHRPYSEFDQAVFRWLGFLLPTRLAM